MKTYMEAYGERLERNQEQLITLANQVLAVDKDVEIYHHHSGYISGLTFIKGESVNSIQFHEVPYRWSGCGYNEFGVSHSGGDNVSMPFTANDVLENFKPINTVKLTNSEYFKNKEHYLKWRSYLTKYNPVKSRS